MVLDNTSGSGAFLVAALQEGRNFIGIEKNEDVALFKKHPVDYIEISKSRIQDTLDMLKLMDNNVLENVVDVNLTKGIH